MGEQVLITNGQGRGREERLVVAQKEEEEKSSFHVVPRLLLQSSQREDISITRRGGKNPLDPKEEEEEKETRMCAQPSFFRKIFRRLSLSPTVVTPTFFTIRFLFLRRSALNTMQPRDLKFGFLFFLPPACTFLFFLRVRPRGPAIPINFFLS